MPKTVALPSPNGRLASLLSQRGYNIIDLQTATFPGVHADIILHNGFHPDMTTSHTSLTETADITLGNIGHTFHHYPTPITLNITGLNPTQIINALEYHLRIGSTY